LPLRSRRARQGCQDAICRANTAGVQCLLLRSVHCCRSRDKPTPFLSQNSTSSNSLVHRDFHNFLVNVLESLLQRRLHRRNIARVALQGRRRKYAKRRGWSVLVARSSCTQRSGGGGQEKLQSCITILSAGNAFRCSVCTAPASLAPCTAAPPAAQQRTRALGATRARCPGVRSGHRKPPQTAGAGIRGLTSL